MIQINYTKKKQKKKKHKSVELSSPASYSSSALYCTEMDYISFSLKLIHFAFCVKGLLHSL